LTKVRAYHTTEPEVPEVYHDDADCPNGQRIKPENLAYGTDGRDLCEWCDDH